MKELGPREYHPYGNYLPSHIEKVIIGSFPIGKFTNPQRKKEINLEKEFDFYYGGSKNPFWPLLSHAFNVPLNTKKEIEDFLNDQHIGLSDVIYSCRRVNGSALDRDLKEIEWNKSLYQKVKDLKVIFTSKNVTNWFDKHIGPIQKLNYKTLVSPSPAALIYLSTTQECINWLSENQEKRVSDYRLYLYKEAFRDFS